MTTLLLAASVSLATGARPAAAVPSAARPAPPPAVEQRVDLMGYVAGFVASIPRARTEGYRAATPAEAQVLADAFRAVRTGDLTQAAVLAASVDYDVVRQRDSATGRRMIALRERRNRDGTWPHAWGLFLFAPDATARVAVEVAHPIADLETELVGVETFRRLDARVLLVAGAHRDADRDGSADVAHRHHSAFQVVHEAAVEPGWRVVQLHGFGESNHPGYGDVVVSAGTADPGPTVTGVWQALRTNGFVACLYDGAACRDLAATSNVQGRQTRSVGATFIHVEAARAVRADSFRRTRMVSAVVDGLAVRAPAPAPVTEPAVMVGPAGRSTPPRASLRQRQLLSWPLFGLRFRTGA